MSNPSLVESFASSLTASSFFDNPAGSAELLRPMDVRKPSEAELKKATPDVRLPPPEYSVQRTEVPFEKRKVKLSTMSITQPSLPASWPRLTGVVNNNRYYNPLLPNLFFRFHSQLYMVHTSMNKPLFFLREMVWRVPFLSSLHRRRWRCVDSITPLITSSCSSIR